MNEKKEYDDQMMCKAITLSRLCVRSSEAFSVGAVIVYPYGNVVSEGYSRERGDIWHAEEVAIEKAREKGVSTFGAHIFSSLEPCSTRLSGRISCCDHIIRAGIKRVVFCVKEPDVFVKCFGDKKLRDVGIDVCIMQKYANEVYEINNHLLVDRP